MVRGRISGVPAVTHPAIEPRLLLGANPVSIQKYCVIVTWLNVCIVVWRHQTRVEDVRLVSDALHALSIDHPDGVGFVQFIDDRSESVSLSAEARAAITELLNRGRPYIKCSSIVFTGEGFRASAVRAIVTGIAWLARPGYPHQVFARTSDAANTLASHLAPPGGSEKKWADMLAQIIHKARDLTAPPSHAPPRPATRDARQPAR